MINSKTGLIKIMINSKTGLIKIMINSKTGCIYKELLLCNLSS